MNSETEKLKQDGLQKFDKKEYKAAAECFQACVAVLESNGQTPESAEMRNNLGVALVRAKEFEAAIEALQGTDQIFATAGDLQKEGMAFANLASAFEGLKKFDEALQAYEKAKECFKNCGEQKMLSIVLKYISDLQMKSGKQFQAMASLQSAYEENPEAGIKTNFFKRALNFMNRKITGR